jgi:hypothetical protein
MQEERPLNGRRTAELLMSSFSRRVNVPLVCPWIAELWISLFPTTSSQTN